MIQFILGLITWTLVEYLTHRFIGHWHDRICAHHVDPKDYSVGPSWLQIALMFFVAGVVMPPLFFVGFIYAFTFYVWLHWSMHHDVFGCTHGPAWLFKLYKHHAIHHWRDDTKNFGVTSPLWDIVFRTRYVPHP